MDPRLAPWLGPGLPLRLRPGGYDAMLDIILAQQVSVASAATLTARLRAAGLGDPGHVRRLGFDGLRALGLTRQKAAYVLALAQARIDWDALAQAPDAEVIARLTALPGIGLWSAEIYLCFALGRPDAFPAGDLALQVAAQEVLSLPARPRDRDLRALADGWRPLRSVAARALWSYYEATRFRKGTP